MAMQPQPDLTLYPKSGANHLLHYSNKTGSFWVGESNKETHHFLMGLISYRETLFSDYQWKIDSKTLSRENAKVEFRPWELERRFENGVNEKLFMPDGHDGLAIKLAHNADQHIQFRLFGDGFIEIVQVDTTSSPHRVTLKTNIKLNSFLTLATDARLKQASLENGDLIVEVSGDKSIKIPDKNEKYISIGLGSNPAQSQREAIIILSNYDVLLASKQKRIQSLIQKVDFKSSDSALTKSVNWALASFDALNMNETRSGLGEGIYAGYPWFQDYWGRDSFIALRALTVTGQFDLAKANLLSFLRYQVQDSSNTNYGKIPNRVRPDESIYNTADATPRFIIEAWEYFAFSQDVEFLEKVMPYINHAIRGTLKYRVDKSGFLTHGAADTWMDAVGPKGPYSPRGDKANDIQALWIMALEKTNLATAKIKGYKSLRKLAFDAEKKVKRSFKEQFSNLDKSGSKIVDAISEKGEKSKEVRVNQIFTLPAVTDNQLKSASIKQVFTELVTPFGPLSLSTKEEWFHPYHKVEPFYEQDASYHNGIIWVWNTGDVVGALLRYGNTDKAFKIIQNYSRRILTDVPLGTLPELYDAFPRWSKWSRSYPDLNQFKHISRLDQMSLKNEAGIDVSKEPAASGTFSQAWSLSEFIRMAVEHLPGIRISNKEEWIIRPNLPENLSSYELNSVIHSALVYIKVEKDNTEMVFQNPKELFSVFVGIPGTMDAFLVRIPKGETKIQIKPGESQVQLEKGEMSIQVQNERELDLDEKGRPHKPIKKRGFFKSDDEISKQVGDLNWTDFSKLDLENKKYKTQLD